MMERKLATLFDRQRFQQNARLAAIIGDVESRYTGAMNDDDLEMVSAAGTMSSIPTVNVEVLLGRHDIPDDEEKKAW